MADDLKRVGLVFKADGTVDFAKSLKTINALTKENYSAFSLAKSQWDKSTSSLTKLKDTQNYLTKQTETYSSKVMTLRSQLEELESAENKDEKAIANKKNQLNNAEASLNKYKKQLNEVTASLESGQAKIEEYAKKVEEFGNKTKKVGESLTTKVSAPIVGLGVAAVKVGSDFDAAMSQVSATSGATGKDLQDLRDKAKEMGASTKFSASESAEAMNYMAMAGWNSKQMIAGLPGILNLAAASNESLANTSDIVTDALTAFGLKAEDSSHFADVLAKTSSSANTNVSLMGETFKYVAPIAGTLGFSVEDTSLAIGLMANAGIKGSQAGTSLKTAIANMVSPSDKMADKMDELGISITDANGQTKPFIQIMQELREKFSKLDKAEQAAAASTIFGKESMSGMLAIINASDSDFNTLYENIKNADGAALDMANTMQDNLQGDLTTLSSALEGLGIKISEALTPALRSITQAVTEFISWLNGLDDHIISVITVVAGLVAAIGPLLVLIGTLAGPVSNAISLFGKMKLAMYSATTQTGLISSALGALNAPIIAIIAIIAVVVAAVINLWNTNEGFRQNVISIVNNISAIVQNLWNNFLKPVFSLIMGIVEELWQNSLLPLWNKVNSFIASIVSDVSKMINKVTPLINLIVNLLSVVLVPVISLVGAVFTTMVSTAINMFSVLLDNISGIVTGISQIFNGLIDFIVGIFTGNWERAIKGIVNIFKGIFSTLGDIVKAPINAVIACINGAISGINSMIRGINKIKIPDWVPGIGGKGFNIGTIGKVSYLAKGGDLLQGTAIVGESGPEVLQQMGTKTRVTPLTGSGGVNQTDLIDYDRLYQMFLELFTNVKVVLDKREMGKFIRSET
ncbi:MAG: phage tail tape measure protein [Faecalibacillus faecis]|uniref:phage tail tape measure protein n=1 Tax=Faecalibacillus faecis TaxID=1982628 RepID=UPI0039943286